MMLVHSQKQLNSIVAIAKKNLEAQGVVVTRRQLEKALSPALSDGQSHEVLSARLKDMPRSKEALAAKRFTERGMEHPASLEFIKCVKELAESTEASVKFGNQMRAYKPIFSSVFSPESFSFGNEELEKFFGKVTYLIDSEERFSLFEFSVSHDDELDSDGFYIHDAKLNLSIETGKNTLHVSAVINPENNSIIELSINKESFGDIINDSEILSSMLEQVVSRIGLNVKISNKFETVFSNEALSVIISEVEEIAEKKTVENNGIRKAHEERYHNALTRYIKDVAWRDAWNALMNNSDIMRKKYALQTQLEYIERRAEKANKRAGKAIEEMQRYGRNIRNS